jgi:hypothetical protein
MGAVSAAGLASAIASGRALANTQNPPTPQTATNPNGKFSGKVVLSGISFEEGSKFIPIQRMDVTSGMLD